MNALVRHVRRLWPGAGVWLPLPFPLWVIVCAAIGNLRWEHVIFVILIPAMAYTNAWTKRLFIGLYPVGLLGLIYDAMRYVKNVGVTPDRVHICDLRALDMRIWSVDDGGGVRGSVHDWLQAHATPALDVYCSIPYGTFAWVAIGFAIYLYWKDYEGMRRFGWTFLLINLAGFVTYHIYPAAPPWYFHQHGCVADLATHASEGPNLMRVDALLGIHYFHGFYGRSADVFGAVPSLHVAYPTLVMLYGWPHFRVVGRSLCVLFFVSMCFAAVYLDHHWIFDVLLGMVYAFGINALVRTLYERRARAHAATAA
jgi:inositol phosphorylceramide synthase catalytic subunit